LHPLLSLSKLRIRSLQLHLQLLFYILLPLLLLALLLELYLKLLNLLLRDTTVLDRVQQRCLHLLCACCCVLQLLVDSSHYRCSLNQLRGCSMCLLLCSHTLLCELGGACCCQLQLLTDLCQLGMALL
jgi:hypothetical protein